MLPTKVNLVMTLGTSTGHWPDVCFLLENRRADSKEPAAFLFERPIHRITALTGDALGPALDALDAECARGRYVCGYVAYEAGAFIAGMPSTDDPSARTGALLDFFSFESRRYLDREAVAAWMAEDSGARLPVAIFGVERTETKESYRTKIAAIKEYIRSGDTYQVNFTLKYRFGFQGTSLSLYRALRERQRVEFGAYIRLPGYEILSFSPELFVRRDAEWLTSKPMKGTAPRGASPAVDERLASGLQRDPKTLSENVMIVDLIRSDVGRIAEVGSVKVDGLFDIQTFETVHQMVSTVRGKIAADTPLRTVLESLFPCGSITGAPKRRTMEIIRELEAEPRGIYTGAIGFVAPSKEFCFSVPIRTVVTQGHRAEMGVGSGIVDESDADGEFDECVLKASFLVGLNSSFRLIESMRFDADTRTLHRRDAHLERLRASAAYFEFVFDLPRLLQAIERVTEALRSGAHKLRVTLAQDGAVSAEAEPLVALDSSAAPHWVVLSDRRIESSSCFQRHKTTERRLYDDEYRAARTKGAYDVVFANERGEIAEASRHNVFIERNGQLVTPPVKAGALPGILRRLWLDDPAGNAVEASVSVDDFRSARTILLTNSVRGGVQVTTAPRGASTS